MSPSRLDKGSAPRLADGHPTSAAPSTCSTAPARAASSAHSEANLPRHAADEVARVPIPGSDRVSHAPCKNDLAFSPRRRDAPRGVLELVDRRGPQAPLHRPPPVLAARSCPSVTLQPAPGPWRRHRRPRCRHLRARGCSWDGAAPPAGPGGQVITVEAAADEESRARAG